jgi:hypothetical protein
VRWVNLYHKRNIVSYDSFHCFVSYCSFGYLSKDVQKKRIVFFLDSGEGGDLLTIKKKALWFWFSVCIAKSLLQISLENAATKKQKN